MDQLSFFFWRNLFKKIYQFLIKNINKVLITPRFFFTRFLLHEEP